MKRPPNLTFHPGWWLVPIGTNHSPGDWLIPDPEKAKICPNLGPRKAKMRPILDPESAKPREISFMDILNILVSFILNIPDFLNFIDTLD